MIENIEIVYPTPGYSFCFQYLEKRRLHFNWHRHKEYEFLLCLEGFGQAHIGDRADSFEGPAAYFIGADIPHGFASNLNFQGWIIQIPFRCFDRIQGRPEFSTIEALLDKANTGVRFSAEYAALMAKKMHVCGGHKGLQLWLDLLSTLETGAHDTSLETCSGTTKGSYDPDSEDPLESILTYIYNEYTKQHTLQEMAELFHLSVASFHRYFKKRTGMSYIEYLHSIRLNNAKKMLLQTNLYVDDICYECGFNNVSFFDRKFKENTGMTPREFRNLYTEEETAISSALDTGVPDVNAGAVR